MLETALIFNYGRLVNFIVDHELDRIKCNHGMRIIKNIWQNKLFMI